MPRAVLGLDVGGANLKAWHTAGVARSVPFALWKDPAGLPRALAALRAGFPAAGRLAATMTGELCDCFESKRQGVWAILDALEAAAAGTPLRVWQNEGRFVSVAEARSRPLPVAGANWLALATFAGRFAPAGPALLLDVGSTTTDVIPLLDGLPVPQGRADPERLRCGELVYTGVRRTPVCALLGDRVAAELFATTLDVYVLLGLIAEDAADRNTADGRPRTRRHAELRLARMLGADLETSTAAERLDLAREARRRQAGAILAAVRRVAGRLPSGPRVCVLAGEGEFLAKQILDEQPDRGDWTIVSLHEQLGAAVSQAACAHAIAVLANEEDA